MKPAPSLLEVRDLRVSFAMGRALHPAVRGLDFDVARGETLALVGESGCGKSSAALALMRLLPASARVSGSVRFEGQSLLPLAPAAMRALRSSAISMIFQEPMSSLNPVHRVGEQIVEVLRAHESLSRHAARARAIELLDRVRIAEPARRFDDFPHQLSGGQRQRIMIAIAIACSPRLLIADEPTTALDVTVQSQILALLDELRRDLQMSLLLITHDLAVVAQFADRVVVMLDGLKVEESKTRDLFVCPSHPYTRKLLSASPHLAPDRQAGPVVDASPLLEVEGLVAGYSRSRSARENAVDGVSFVIGVGETLGLIGESGCGKSTLARALMRLMPLRAGTLRFDGVDIGMLPERALRGGFRRRVQMVFQDPFGSLNPRQTVGEILDVVLRVQGVSDRALRLSRAERMLDRVGLPADSRGRHPNEFSGGQRQRIAIARALLSAPSLLILDEPVSALDVSIQAQILALLLELKTELGLSYLFISHDLAVVRQVADRVVVMHEGRFVETGRHPDLWVAPAHPYTRSLLSAAPKIPWRSDPAGQSAAVTPPST